MIDVPVCPCPPVSNAAGLLRHRYKAVVSGTDDVNIGGAIEALEDMMEALS